MEIYYEKDGGLLQYCGATLTSDHSRQTNLRNWMKLSIPELELDIYLDNSTLGETEIEELKDEMSDMEIYISNLEDDLKAAEKKISELERNLPLDK